MEKLADLPNIGHVLENHLRAAGIFTCDDLKKYGSKEAFRRIRISDPGACLHMLYSLEGAIRNVRYFDLDEETKQELRLFFKSFT